MEYYCEIEYWLLRILTKQGKLQNVSRCEGKIRQGEKNKTKKNMVQVDTEIATLNKQKTVARAGWKQYNL